MQKLITTVALIFFYAQTSFALLNWTEVEIPMSDGQTLAADVYLPNGWTDGPAILIQTPYWKNLYHVVGLPLGIFYNQEEMDYAIVIVDWRGFFGSTDAAYAGSPTRGEDGYDVVEWIAAQEWSDGKVGTWGPSALGRVQFLTAREHPPHLVCMVPQVASPLYEYQEYYPNGVARTEYLEQLDALGFGTSPVVYANPYYSFPWSFTEETNHYPDEIEIPTFMIGGWYDHNVDVMVKTFSELQTLSPVSVQQEHRLLMGPWVHGGSGTAFVGSTMQGELVYPQAEGWADSLAFRFFDFYLKEIDNGWNTTPKVQYFQMGDDEWTSSDSWPVIATSQTKLYLHPDMSAKTIWPDSPAEVDFSYNPEDPSPTIGGPTLRTDLDQGPFDQSEEVESREDVLVFSTEPLTQDVVVKGVISVHLSVSTDVLDTDVAVRLCDVYPDGRSMLLSNGIYRMRFLNGFEAGDESFLTPGSVYEVNIALPHTAITFQEGHQIRLDISGSNYPMYNRNMNTGGEMYPEGNGDTLINPIIANNTLHLSTSTDNGSYITLPIVGSFPNSVDEMAMGNTSIHFYPNPAVDQIRIDVHVDELNILDTQNRIVKVFSNYMALSPIDIGDLPAGQYVVVTDKITLEEMLIVPSRK